MKKLSFFILTILTGFLLTACQEEKNHQTSNADATSEEIQSNNTEEMTAEEIIDFVDTWKNLYATHTFDNYIKLYDTKEFIGIKRTLDKKKYVYDYSGWYDNKRNEFKKYDPDITIENVKVKSLNINGRSKVSFIQTWISYKVNYADRGEKVLILKKLNGEIYIEKEELLYSTEAYDVFGT